MTDSHQEIQRIRNLLLRLLEIETGDDEMICHDGGFRYAGDFMTMESDIVEAATILSAAERQLLQNRGLIADGDDGLRVTEKGRAFALRIP